MTLPTNRSSTALTSTTADDSPEAEWLRNFQSVNTRRAYSEGLQRFAQWLEVSNIADLRHATRGAVLKYRDALKADGLADATICRLLGSLSSYYAHLVERQIIRDNPAQGVKRPKLSREEGSTPAISDKQARALLDAPPSDTLKGLRDRAILATLIYHGLRREELVRLRVGDYAARQGVFHFRVRGKGNKTRYVPVAPTAQEKLEAYFGVVTPGNLDAPIFRSLCRNGGYKVGANPLPLTGDGVYSIVMEYARQCGITIDTLDFRVHSLRATAATKALSEKADIVEVQKWLGHSDIKTTQMYDRRESKVEDSPSFKVRY